jgi:uracil permease
MKMSNKTVDVNERLPLLQSIPLSLQHLFAMFGATVLVPYLVGLDTSVTLFTSGLGTLLYILITKGKIPAYLGSSFAFIAGMSAIIGADKGALGAPDKIAIAMGGCAVAGIVYLVVAGLIVRFGTNWLDRALPPVVVGSVVIVIGLALAQTAVNMAMCGSGTTYNPQYLLVALVALTIAVLASVFLRGFLGVIPILIGGYLFAMCFGMVDFKTIVAAKPFAVPHFIFPKFTLGAALAIAPVALVTIAEHIGHLIVTNKVVGRDFIKDPGLHRSLSGDGIATTVAAFLGGPPNTTYGENIGVLAITRVFSVWIIGGAAVIAIILSFIPKFGNIVASIPVPVMGGISILLFGTIAAAGIRMLVESKVDFSQKRNLIIAAVILVIGIGEAKINLGGVEFHGMALATIIGIILNLIIPQSPEEENPNNN